MAEFYKIFFLLQVVLIMGVMGASRRDELYRMKVNDLEDLGTAILVKIPNTKTKTSRKFTVTGEYSDIVKKYWSMRPVGVIDNSFFVNYQKGKCTTQKVGINKIGNMGKQIATFLKLQNPELYTGHCFRRSSATILVDSGEDITTLKRHGGWRSTAVAEGYIEESLTNKNNVAKKIMGSINQSINLPSTSISHNLENNVNLSLKNADSNSPKIVFNNCSNITLNINNK